MTRAGSVLARTEPVEVSKHVSKYITGASTHSIISGSIGDKPGRNGLGRAEHNRSTTHSIISGSIGDKPGRNVLGRAEHNRSTTHSSMRQD